MDFAGRFAGDYPPPRDSIMNPEQIALIRGSWQLVVPMQDKAVEMFYARLFEIDPALRSMFLGDMDDQRRKVAVMLNLIVNKLDKPDELFPAAAALARRHVGYGVKGEHYDTVGAALLWTLATGLGQAFTDDVKAAWIAAYTVLCKVMIDAATMV